MSAVGRPAPTTFFREIDRNRRRSWLLIGAVIVLLGLLGGAIGYATGFGWGGVVVAVIVAAVMSVGSFFGGDALVMATSGAREVDRAKPADRYQQLVNVVEEMRLAGGLPPPRIWIIEDSAPNAFATGRDPQHASVAVTTGLLDKLDREQLQEELTTTENQIGFSRQHYNSTVREFNTAIQTFPNVLIAGMFGFRERDYFQIAESDAAVPEVDLRTA